MLRINPPYVRKTAERPNQHWRKAIRTLRRYPRHVRASVIRHWRENGKSNDPRKLLAVVHQYDNWHSQHI